MTTLSQIGGLPIPRSSDGWLLYPPSANLIYVDSMVGNDSNVGSQFKPIKSLAAIPLRRVAGKPNVALLQRGQVWNSQQLPSNIAGESATLPFIITSYGLSQWQPKILPPKGQGGWVTNGINNVVIQDVTFVAQGRTIDQGTPQDWPGEIAGISATRCSNLWIEGCLFRGFGNNIVIQYSQNITIRRNVILDAWKRSNSGHSQGIYMHGIKGALVQDNFLDHNGYINPNLQDYSTPAGLNDQTIFNHGMYLTAENEGIITDGNIVSRSSATGIQQRAGGNAKSNVLLRNPVGFNWGVVNGGGQVTKGGVSGAVSRNVVLGGDDISSAGDRGLAFCIGNVKQGVWTQNVAAVDTQKLTFYAYNLQKCIGVDENDSVGVHNLMMQDCLVYKWDPHLTVDNLSGSLTGKSSIGNVVCDRCNFTKNQNTGAIKFTNSKILFDPVASIDGVVIPDIIKLGRSLAGPRNWNAAFSDGFFSNVMLKGFGF